MCGSEDASLALATHCRLVYSNGQGAINVVCMNGFTCVHRTRSSQGLCVTNLGLERQSTKGGGN